VTAETFTAIAEEDVLLDLAAELLPERLPPLLLSAAIARRVAEIEPLPLAAYYPYPAVRSPRATTGSAPRCAPSPGPRRRRCAGCAGTTATR
jgi:hypothetical protein